MKILFCCEFYAPSIGGVQEVMRQLAEHLACRGHHVTVATSKITSRSFSELNNVKIVEFDITGNIVNGIHGEVDNYRSFVLSQDFDVIMIKAAQQWSFDALWPILPKISPRKIFIPCGFSALFNKDYIQYYQQMPDILRAFDHLIFYTSNYRDINFAKSHNISNYSIVPNGASEIEFNEPPSLDFRKTYAIPDDDFIFLSIGKPTLPKGHLEIALAYERISLPFPSTLILNNNFIFHNSMIIKCKQFIKNLANQLLGNPPFPSETFKQTIKNIAKQSNKQIKVMDLPRNELISAYFAANLFVFASHVEYSPLVLFESAAAGLPFLSGPVGNAEEIISWTGGGELCPAKQDSMGNTTIQPDALAKKMSQLAQDKEKLTTLGNQGRYNWEKNFSWDIITNLYESILQGINQ